MNFIRNRQNNYYSKNYLDRWENSTIKRLCHDFIQAWYPGASWSWEGQGFDGYMILNTGLIREVKIDEIITRLRVYKLTKIV